MRYKVGDILIFVVADSEYRVERVDSVREEYYIKKLDAYFNFTTASYSREFVENLDRFTPTKPKQETRW